MERSVKKSKLELNLEMALEESSPLLQLPNELWIIIFDFLPYKDQKNTRRVCKHWSSLAVTSAFILKTKLVLSNSTIGALWRCIRTQDNKHLMIMRIKSLEVSWITWRDTQRILARLAPHVRSLRLNCVRDFQIYKFKWPNLIALTIMDKTYVRSYLESLLHDKTELQLKELHMECENDCQEFLINVLHKFAPTLTTLNVIFHTHTASPEIELLCPAFQQLRKLKHLDLRCDDLYAQQWLVPIIDAIPDEAPVQKLQLNLFEFRWYPRFVDTVYKWANTLSTLKIIAIVMSNKTTDGDFKVSVEKCNRALRKLHLRYVGALNDEAVYVMVMQLSNLQQLHLENSARDFSNVSLSYIFRHLPGLRVLVLKGLHVVTDDGFMGFGEQPYSIQCLKQLQSLTLEECPKVTKTTLMSLCHLPVLRSLTLKFMKGIAAADVRKFSQTWTAMYVGKFFELFTDVKCDQLE